MIYWYIIFGIEILCHIMHEKITRLKKHKIKLIIYEFNTNYNQIVRYISTIN